MQHSAAAAAGRESPLRHVALFMHGFDDGGAQRRVLTLAAWLIEAGLQVDVITTRADGPLRSRLPDGARLTVFASRWHKPALRMHAAVPRVVTWLRRERPQVFIAAANHAVLPAIRAHRAAAVPDIALALRISNAVVAHRERLSDPLKRRLWRLALPQADAVACVAAALERELLSLAPALRGRIHTISNPVLDRLPDAQPRRIDQQRPVILAVGRLVEQKDFATLLRAFALVRARVPAHLRILGEGPQLAMLQQLAKDLAIAADVDFAGFVDDPSDDFLRASVTVLSSRWEGMPGVLVEAMSHGCPVVSTDCAGGSRELLQDGQLGRLAPVGDGAALADAIVATLQTTTDGDALRRRAADFTAAVAGGQFLAVLQAAAQRAGRQRRADN